VNICLTRNSCSMLADGLLLWHSDSKTGVHCRWWRKTLLDINPRGTQTVLRKWVKPRRYPF
jgi:hypothetical protein